MTFDSFFFGGVNGFGGVFSAFSIPRLKRSSAPGSSLISGFGFLVMVHQQEEQKLLALVGDIATSWSQVELYWYLIFTTLMPETPRAQVDAIFFMFDTGKRQRELVMKMADIVYPNDQNGHRHKLNKRLGQLNALTDEASGDRNAAVHGQFYLTPSLGHLAPAYFRISPGSNPYKKNKFAGQNVETSLLGAIAKVNDLNRALKDHLEKTIPKSEVSPELIEALQKQGFQVPTWMVARKSPPGESPKT